MRKLFTPVKFQNIELKNRIVMSPMCMYSCFKQDGMVTPFHFTHLVSRAVGQVGLVITEATAVLPEGRISPQDLGIWDDAHTDDLRKLNKQLHASGAKTGIQLAHAGRKAVLESDSLAPSAIPFNDSYKIPSEMTAEDIRRTVEAFGQAARRAKEAAFDVIEIHGAHGYLINEFLSPLTNKRKDDYGGSLENRTRFLREIIQEINTVWPEDKPIILRVSGEEYVNDGNHPEDLVDIINLVKDEGIDIINVSSGAVVHANIDAYPGYQVPFAETIKKGTGLPVIAGGLITEPEMAEEILKNNRADFIFLGRELLRNPYWPLEAANKLKEDIEWPHSYRRAKI